MKTDPFMEFEVLGAVPGLAHRFTLRNPEVDVDGGREEVIGRLRASHEGQVMDLGFAPGSWRVAEQIHGGEVAVVGGSNEESLEGVDGMITNEANVMLSIYVADCCAVYLVDAVANSLGLVHSGRKGSEVGITGIAIQRMVAEHGARPERIRVLLSPCIRPPLYEVDFAAMIRASAADAGVPETQIHDEGLCTGADLTRFYSYRMENGRTGRMLALMGWRRSADSAERLN